MYVYICFDIEDPENIDTNDVALDIAEILADEGIICSMLDVGEKARLWEKRAGTFLLTFPYPQFVVK